MNETRNETSRSPGTCGGGSPNDLTFRYVGGESSLREHFLWRVFHARCAGPSLFVPNPSTDRDSSAPTRPAWDREIVRGCPSGIHRCRWRLLLTWSLIRLCVHGRPAGSMRNPARSSVPSRRIASICDSGSDLHMVSISPAADLHMSCIC